MRGGRITATSTTPRGPPAWKKRSFHDFQLGGFADKARLSRDRGSCQRILQVLSCETSFIIGDLEPAPSCVKIRVSHPPLRFGRWPLRGAGHLMIPRRLHKLVLVVLGCSGPGYGYTHSHTQTPLHTRCVRVPLRARHSEQLSDVVQFPHRLSQQISCSLNPAFCLDMHDSIRVVLYHDWQSNSWDIMPLCGSSFQER